MEHGRGERAVTTMEIDAGPQVPAPPQSRPVGKQRRWISWLLLGLAAVCFAYGVTTIPAAVPSQWGLLAVASPLYGLSYLLTAAGFIIAVRQSSMPAAICAVVLIVIVGRLPSAVATDMPMYAWTYKHLGVVDSIMHTHQLARDVDIYNGWPGLFAVTAWFSELTGLAPVDIAHWWAPLFYSAFTIVTYAMGRAWGLAPLGSVTVAFMAATFSWVWQDYFAPQSAAIFLSAGMLILVALSRERRVVAWPIIVVFAALTITHQLTPYWMLLIIGVLVITRQMKPWWIVIPLAAMLFAFLYYNQDQTARYAVFSSDVVANLKGNIPTVGVLGQRVTKVLVRALAIGLWLPAAIITFIRWRQKKPFWAPAVVAFSSMILPLVGSYGNEVVFRVFLYSMFGCALIISPVLVKILQSANMKVVSAGFVAVLFGTAAAAQGYTGSWYANVMPKAQVQTASIVLNQAELPAYITAVAPVWPERSNWRYVNYARFNKTYDEMVIQEQSLAGRHFDNEEDYRMFIKALYGRSDVSTYLIMTDQMQVYAWYFGILPWDALPNLKERIKRDPVNWQPFYEGQGITVFLHKVNVVN